MEAERIAMEKELKAIEERSLEVQQELQNGEYIVYVLFFKTSNNISLHFHPNKHPPIIHSKLAPTHNTFQTSTFNFPNNNMNHSTLLANHLWNSIIRVTLSKRSNWCSVQNH